MSDYTTMKILLVNNHHKILGGAERYYFELSTLLASKGNIVGFFSTRDRDNKPSKWQRYFIEKIDFTNNDLRSFFPKLKRMVYSFDSKKKIAAVLNDFQPDIVHIQNIYYYISPSILSEIKKRNIPIVQTVHDYQLISPSVNLFHDGKICEITKPHDYYRAILHRCIKNSYQASLMAVVSSYTQRMGKFYEKYVDYFISPSIFVKNKLIEYGFNAHKVVHIPNFYHSSVVSGTDDSAGENRQGQFVLFFGRLAEQKGIFDLLTSASYLRVVPFKLVGFYENKNTKQRILNFINEHGLKNVGIVAFQGDEQLRKILSRCAFTIVPSCWYENQPYSILESYAQKRPVIASNIGGIPEIVKHGKTGLLFTPENTAEMAEKIFQLWNNPSKTIALGMRACQYAETKFAPDLHYQRLFRVYTKAVRGV